MLTRFKAAVDAFRGQTRSAHLWDAAGRPSNLLKWGLPAPSPNRHFDNPVILRGEAESLYRNNSFIRKGIDALINGAVGATGLNPNFREKAAQLAWENWAGYKWAALQDQILSTVVVSGEVFVVIQVDPTASTVVPISLTILGPEYLDTSRNDRETYAGIRYKGKDPSGYWLFLQNPSLAQTALPSVFIPANRCLHVFKPITPGAQRGQTALAPVMLAARELDEFLQASLVKQKTSALLTVFVTSPDGSNPLNPATEPPGLEPGAAVLLNPGQTVEQVNPPETGELEPFVRSQLRRIAAGLGVPYETLSGDYSQVTFASGRAGLLEFKRRIESLQYGLLVNQFCEPLMAIWGRIASALGVIPKMPENVRWIGPTIEMLDQNAETRAVVAKIRAGLMSRSEAVAQTGWRAEDIDAEIAIDNARADQLGLIFDSDPRKVTAQGQTQQEVINV